MSIDAVDLEVVKASLSGIVQEMQNSLFRTGFSTIVRESQDASCALLNASGEVVAQHVVLPLHIGAFPACCAAVIKEYGDDISFLGVSSGNFVRGRWTCPSSTSATYST